MSSFSLVHWLIIGAIIWVIFKVFSKGPQSEMFCKTCGHTGKTQLHTPGNLLIEIILWLCFIVPGLIYSIWRISNRVKKCTQCESKDLVPKNSPMALASRKQLGIDANS